MKTFNFWANWVNFGDWRAHTEEEAKEIFAQDSGYRSWSHMIEETGVDDVVVQEVQNVMKTFNFWANFVDLGNWKAHTENEAKEIFAQDSGYQSWSHMIDEKGDHVVVEEVHHDE